MISHPKAPVKAHIAAHYSRIELKHLLADLSTRAAAIQVSRSVVEMCGEDIN